MELFLPMGVLKGLLSFLAIVAGIFVITTKNAIISVFNLIVLYILIAFYLMYLGMTYLGISYIVVVRRLHICVAYLLKYNQYSHLIAASELGERESLELNLASLQKAEERNKQPTFLIPQAAFSKVKARLLEVNFPLVLNIGHNQGCIKIITYLFDMKQLLNKGIYSTNYIINVRKEKSLLPKENERTYILTTGKPNSSNRNGFRAIVVPGKYLNTLYDSSNIERKGRIATYSLLKFREYSTESTTVKSSPGRGMMLGSPPRRDGDPKSNILDKNSPPRGSGGASFNSGPARGAGDRLNKLNQESKNLKSIDRTIYSLVYNLDMLKLAYENLKSKSGNMTFGILPETLEGISIDILSEISTDLKTEKFQFKPYRKEKISSPTQTNIILTNDVLIPAPRTGIWVGERKVSPAKGKKVIKGIKEIKEIKLAGDHSINLLIAPLRDKLVQEIMRMILEAIFEPRFQDESHGFRSNKSCHTALKYAEQKLQSSV